MASTGDALGDRFDPRANALNAVRLCLALGVIFWHSFPFTGNDVAHWPIRQLLGQGFVDAFFAVSGFLIVDSWVRRPHWREFIGARILRVVPAFWVCLVVTAAVFGPLAAGPTRVDASVAYVLDNARLVIHQATIGSTLEGAPVEAWNGSLWTLEWEFACYLLVLLAGAAGLLRRSWGIPVLFGGAFAWFLLTEFDPSAHYRDALAGRFYLMFAAGALVYHFRARLPLNRALLGMALAVVLASSMLPDYRLVAAVPLAYLVIGIGACFHGPRLRHDLSYGTYIYAFPVQQILVLHGAAAWGVAGFAVASVVATIPFAAASWFLVERPALGLKRQLCSDPLAGDRLQPTAVA